MSQLTYSESAADAFAGMLADSEESSILGRANGDSVDLEFGIMVTAKDTTDPNKEIKRTDETYSANDLLGVLAHKHTQDRSLLDTTEGLLVDAMGDVVRKGRIWVRIEETVVVGDAVFYRFAAGGGGTALGRFRNDADTATCAALPGATWIKGGTVALGAIALLEVNLPAGS
jgi:hypothetical protein